MSCHHQVFLRAARHGLPTRGLLTLWMSPLKAFTVSFPCRHLLGSVLFPFTWTLALGGTGALLILWPPLTHYQLVCRPRAWPAPGGSAELGCHFANASQDWFYSLLVRPPCPSKALSGPWRQSCYLGVLPTWASPSGKPQRPLETAGWTNTHAHTQTHTVCTHTDTALT